MELIALLSIGQGTWGQVAGLINRHEWDNIILLGNSFAEKFTCDKKHEFIKVDTDQRILELRDEIKEKLKDKIKGMEVAVSIASGEGKEHMALISALISLPVGVRFVALTQDGIIDLTQQGKALLEKETGATFL
jgi:hypothetical protein